MALRLALGLTVGVAVRLVLRLALGLTVGESPPVPLLCTVREEVEDWVVLGVEEREGEPVGLRVALGVLEALAPRAGEGVAAAGPGDCVDPAPGEAVPAPPLALGLPLGEMLPGPALGVACPTGEGVLPPPRLGLLLWLALGELVPVALMVGEREAVEVGVGQGVGLALAQALAVGVALGQAEREGERVKEGEPVAPALLLAPTVPVPGRAVPVGHPPEAEMEVLPLALAVGVPL